MNDSVCFFFKTPGSDFVPAGGPLRVSAEYAPLGDTASRLTVTWENAGARPLECRLELRVRTDFVFTHYLIPAVSYNGNGWGCGNEPKGLLRGGEPWVFDARRTSIPACTLSENRDRFFAMFALNEPPASLNASCSMIPCADGTMLHRLLYPAAETPETYCARDRYCGPRDSYLTLRPGERLRTAAVLMRGAPEKENFAAAQVEELALALLPAPFSPKYAPEETETLCCAFAECLLEEKNGRPLFSIGKTWNGDAYVFRGDFEFGWCGQNGMYARLFLLRGDETGNPALLETGERVLDLWAGGVGRTGLLYTRYNAEMEPDPTADTCNLSYAVAEFAAAYGFFKRRGKEKPGWLAAARGVADFLISRYDPENGFGKAWSVRTGACADPGGTVGAFMIPALCVLYRETDETRYLEAAKAACRLYHGRDLARFACTAGALDTCCIDKETSWPLLAGGIALYELCGDAEWLECAREAAVYFCSWMFHYDAPPVPDSDFERYGYRTLGGTSVSAQHHHLDPWGVLAVPQLVKLARYVGDAAWLRRAALLWANAVQNIAPAEGLAYHGHRRPAGAQNEAYFHCAWGDGTESAGRFNEWLVAWPQAFCWSAARFLRGLPPEEAAGFLPTVAL